LKTIADAKNVRPGVMRITGRVTPGGSRISIPAYTMTYDPFEKKEAPARGQTGKAQG
jgi:hypothetical protein